MQRHKGNSIFFFVLFLVFIFSLNAHAKKWYVDSDAPKGGDGASWYTAFNHLQSAIDAVSGTYMICMAPPDQIYVKSGTYTFKSTIELDKYVSVYGGFPNAMATPEMSDRNWKKFPTVLNGEGTKACLSITSNAIFDGFVVRNGYNPGGNGAGIYIKSNPVYCSIGGWYHTPKIRNCSIEYNNGGGIFDDASSPFIEDCTFLGNTSTNGGAIASVNSAPRIERCLFKGNQATAPSSRGGGAIDVVWACYSGSCDTPVNSPVKITNCLFRNNSCHTEVSPAGGGAIHLYQLWEQAKITNCTFVDNSAPYSSGGAVFTKNHSCLIQNSILWGNSPNQIGYSGEDYRPRVNYTDIQDGWTGPGHSNIDANPDFVSAVNFHLQAGSPCIDAANDAVAPDEDLEKTPRPLDGDGDGTATTDMGAYEAMAEPCQGDFDNDKDVDGADLSVFAADFGRTNCDKDCEGDFDKDNDVDGKDLSTFAEDFGRTDCPQP